MASVGQARTAETVLWSSADLDFVAIFVEILE